MITISCPDCSKSYKLSSDMIGKKVRCKACNTSFPVTDPVDLEADDDPPTASSRQRGSVSRAEKPATKKLKASAVEDDEFAGLNSVSSDGEALDELPSLPSRPKRSSRKLEEDDDDEPKLKRKRKASSGRSSSFGGPLAAILAAGVGGSVGAIVWGAIVILTQHEIGWIAWGIGLLVGVCVRYAAGDMDEFMSGIIAAVASAVSILGGKAGVALLIVCMLPAEEWDAPVVNMTAGQRFLHLLLESFGPIDIVFFILAIATAYRVGANRQEGEVKSHDSFIPR